MNRTATYPPKFPRPAMGGYRYFFNGQEGDDEVLGEGALHAFEYRMHDTRTGRFWSVDNFCFQTCKARIPYFSFFDCSFNCLVSLAISAALAALSFPRISMSWARAAT